MSSVRTFAQKVEGASKPPANEHACMHASHFLPHCLLASWTLS